MYGGKIFSLIVCATVNSQCLEYLGHITLALASLQNSTTSIIIMVGSQMGRLSYGSKIVRKLEVLGLNLPLYHLMGV